MRSKRRSFRLLDLRQRHFTDGLRKGEIDLVPYAECPSDGTLNGYPCQGCTQKIVSQDFDEEQATVSLTNRKRTITFTIIGRAFMRAFLFNLSKT